MPVGQAVKKYRDSSLTLRMTFRYGVSADVLLRAALRMESARIDLWYPTLRTEPRRAQDGTPSIPQGLKAKYFSAIYVRPEGRT
jgi:hypothetical protein